MNIEELRKICLSLPSVTEDINWDNNLCFSIGGKMFLICGLDQNPLTASFKVNEEDFVKFSNTEGFKPAPYLARYKWIYSSDVSQMNKKQWEVIIKNSYDLIRSKLPKKILAELE